MKFIKAAVLRELAEAGAVTAAHLVPLGGWHFGLQVEVRNGERRTLRPAHGAERPRPFTLDAAAKYVRDLGLDQLDADLSGWTAPARLRTQDGQQELRF